MPILKRETLTRAKVEGAQPDESAYRLWDAKVPGLCLRVLPSGVKTFELHLGRNMSERIGRHPGVTLDAARTQAQARLGEFASTGARKKPKAKATSLAAFVTDEFQPWASANLKWGDGAADRILSVFAEFASKPLADIDALAIERWRSKRIKAGISPNTCNRDLATLKSALARARAWKLLDGDPLANVKQTKVDSTRVRYLHKPEETRLRAALEARDAEGRAARARANEWRRERARELLVPLHAHDFADHLTPAVLVSLNTGLRRGELTALETADVNLKGKMLTVRAAAAKSGKTRHVPLNTEAASVLKQWMRQNGGEGRLFPFYDFKTAWTALLDAAKIEGFRWHDLRHTFASKLVMAGVDLNTVRELMGHGDIKMTLRYAHLAPEHKAAAVERICG